MCTTEIQQTAASLQNDPRKRSQTLDYMETWLRNSVIPYQNTTDSILISIIYLEEYFRT